ncbi:MAG: hypothetical protein JRN20_02020 [Nitrososphaerota archaeon]|nr:hypothetical protein [Nitrososphaerota archaeon]MDG6923397.1 hypothetical protein [Nitrososphaerota archaeon]
MTLNLRARASLRAIIGVAIVFLLLSVAEHSQAQEDYTSTSWALGIVVPQGARLAGGGSLQWEDVQNVTADVTLPNISEPDQIVYAVLSVMTEDGDVLQVAAGVFPNSTIWLVYSWLFTNLNSNPVKYQWILNSSLPKMSANSRLSISIFHSPASDSWALSVASLNTNSFLVDDFPTNISSTLRAGDQEVFALESYSRSASTFEEMGNLTLNSLLFDGMPLTNGFYSYNGGWDPNHNPLFVIGTEGTIPPTFISLQKGINSLVFWNYTNAWSSGELTNADGFIPILFVSILFGSIIVLVGIILATRR